MMKSALLLVALVVCQSQGFMLPKVKTVDKLELKRYLGTFYEVYSSLIQRQTFQKNAFCTSGTLSLKDDGNVKVVNSRRVNSPTGKQSSTTGTAQRTSNPAAFIVNFPRGRKSTTPNYLVVKLGPPTYGKDGLYEYSIVSTPGKRMMWVLARNPTDFKTKYDQEVLEYLKKNGYNTLINKPRPTYQGKDCVYSK